jgi:hypothetical protein
MWKILAERGRCYPLCGHHNSSAQRGSVVVATRQWVRRPRVAGGRLPGEEIESIPFHLPPRIGPTELAGVWGDGGRGRGCWCLWLQPSAPPGAGGRARRDGDGRVRRGRWNAAGAAERRGGGWRSAARPSR